MNENDDKVIGILSYIGILWIVAYIMYSNNNQSKTEFSLFHLRQGLGIFVSVILAFIFMKIFFPIGMLLFVAAIGFAIVGIINVANGEKKELPLIGQFISDNLKGFK